MGRLDVDEVLSLPAWKLDEWRAYDLLDPFGEERDDYRMAMVVCALLNPHKKKGVPAFKPADWMPRFGERFYKVEREMTVEQQVHRAFSIAAAMMR
jgi:hypothetical protein